MFDLFSNLINTPNPEIAYSNFFMFCKYQSGPIPTPNQFKLRKPSSVPCTLDNPLILGPTQMLL